MGQQTLARPTHEPSANTRIATVAGHFPEGLSQEIMRPLFGLQRTSVTLRWDPSPDKHVISYRIYYADVTRKKAAKAKSLDIGRTTHATIPNLVAGHTYYFVVRALNSAGRESEPSNLVKYVAGSRPSNSK